MAMDAKDLRTEAALSDRSKDGIPKYAQSGNVPYNKNKQYQDYGSNPIAKVDVQTSRPCAVIGPDRVLPPPVANDAYMKKSLSESSWPADTMYRRPPDYPHKLPEYQHPTRNISPRQTFQENMQRIMVPPTYNSVKLKEDNFSADASASPLRNNKLNVPSDPKYCDVPYNINPLNAEQKNIRNSESVSNVNSVLSRTTPQGWPPSTNVHPLKPYGAPEMYQYPEYPSCAGPRPVLMSRPHRASEEAGRVFAEPFYHEGTIRFKPYPTVKDRYPQTRYDYMSNYTNPFHPPPAFPPHKYDIQKSIPPHPYPGYPQVPMKYLDTRMTDPVMNVYQRSPNQQQNFNPTAYRNQILHPTYGSIPNNCLQTNKFYPYPSDTPVKPIASNKLPYDANNKMYADYENIRNRNYPPPESFYNGMQRPHLMKGPSSMNYPPGHSIHAIPSHPYYRKENQMMKGYEYNPHFRNIDPLTGNPIARLPAQFSPSAIAISPSDSNTSNDTTQTQGTLHEDYGYVSQSSSASIRSMDSVVNRIPNDLRRYDYRYGQMVRTSHEISKPELNNIRRISSKEAKDIDLRQYLQSWNEGDDENANSNKEIANRSHQLCDISSKHAGNSQEQLYVLGLVNVPSEELSKYEHIQKVSKLPENIKGYSSIELLNQFEEVIESSNLNNYNVKQPNVRSYHGSRSSLSMQELGIPPRPISPLDVEAKISQSVIHKDVGCNFEIKPCSPKMLNVEIAAPLQSVLGERAIEKVCNPLLQPIKVRNIDNNTDKCHVIQHQDHRLSNDSLNVPSCKMVRSQYSHNDNIGNEKNNYSLQDYESSSGVCLASLPRLDNDIELSFPEVNQQFINANKVDSVISATPSKDLPTLEEDQFDKIENVPEDSKSIPYLSKNETTKEIRKSNKIKKRKRKNSESKNTQAVRTDSVIIKNPDNIKSRSSSPKTAYGDTQLDPINLTVYSEDRTNDIENLDLHNTAIERPNDFAIDFSLNSNNYIEPATQTTFIDDISSKKNNHDITSYIEVDINSKVITELCTDSEKQVEKLDETIITKNIKEETRLSPDSSKSKTRRKSEVVETINNIQTSDNSIKTIEEPHIDVIANVHESKERFSEIIPVQQQDSIIEKCKENSLLAVEKYFSYNESNDNDTIKYTNKIEHPNSSTLCSMEISEKTFRSRQEIDTNLVTLVKTNVMSEPSQQSTLKDNNNLKNSKKKDYRINKEMYSPWIQKLIVHNEGSCTGFRESSGVDFKMSKEFNSACNSMFENLNSIPINIDTIVDKPEMTSSLEDTSRCSLDDIESNLEKILCDRTDNSSTNSEVSLTITQVLGMDEISKNIKQTSDSLLSDLCNDEIPVSSKSDKPNTEINFKTTANCVQLSISEEESSLNHEIPSYAKNINNEKVNKESESDNRLDLKDESGEKEPSCDVKYESEVKKPYNFADTIDSNDLPESMKKNINGEYCFKESLHTSVNFLNESNDQSIESINPSHDTELKTDRNDSSIKGDPCEEVTGVDNQYEKYASIINDSHVDESFLADSCKKDTSVIDPSTMDSVENVACVEDPCEKQSCNVDSQESDACVDISEKDSCVIDPSTVDAHVDDSCLEDIGVKYPCVKNPCTVDSRIDDSIFGKSCEKDLVLKNTYVQGELEQTRDVNDISSRNEEKSESDDLETDRNTLTNNDKSNLVCVADCNPGEIRDDVLQASNCIKNNTSSIEINDPISAKKECYITENNILSSCNIAKIFEDDTIGLGADIETNITTCVEGNNIIRDSLTPDTDIESSHEDSADDDNKKINLLKKRNKSKMFTSHQNTIVSKQSEIDIPNDSITSEPVDIIENQEVLDESDIGYGSFSEINAEHCVEISNVDISKDVFGLAAETEDHQNCYDATILCDEDLPNTVIEISQEQLERCNAREEPNTLICESHKNTGLINGKNTLSNKRISLKRSLSDSDLNCYNSDQNAEQESLLWPNKRKKIIENAAHFITQNYCNILQNQRRNSLSSIQNEENISFCILIDDNCIITEENNESEKICFTEIPEDCLACVREPDENDQTLTEVMTYPEDTNYEYSQNSTPNCTDQETASEELWVEDIACIETVGNDDIAEDVIISAASSPRNTGDVSDSDNSDESENIDANKHTDKVKYIYGDKMCSDDAQLVETLYRTPQMDVNKTLACRESHEAEEPDRYYDKESLEKVLSEPNNFDETSCELTGIEFDKTSLCSSILIPSEKSLVNRENFDFEKQLLPLNSGDTESEDKEDICVNSPRFHKEAQSESIDSCESSADDIFSYDQTDNTKHVTSSSPEVSSTTSEEKASSILLKITNYNGARISEVNDIRCVPTRTSCKYTENNDYLSSHTHLPPRPLLTKAAQKYIPPLKETIRDLKVKLPLPEHSLIKLKRLKVSKDKPKQNVNQKKQLGSLRRSDIPKKLKPKFEDVLKSIDEIQFKLQKDNKNKKAKKSVPKVVIKKNENGSHYASSQKEKFNPDLTGRKWQPWVILEKNQFIDKMALKKKTKAVFSHRKNTYVFAEKFQMYRSIERAKFIISQPKLDNTSKNSGPLKYTIKLKHNY